MSLGSAQDSVSNDGNFIKSFFSEMLIWSDSWIEYFFPITNFYIFKNIFTNARLPRGLNAIFEKVTEPELAVPGKSM